jgi:hypothetical protein
LEQLHDILYLRSLRHTTSYHHNIPCCTIPSHTVTCCTVPSRTIRHHTIPGFAIPHHTILYHGAPHQISRHHTTLCHAVNAMPCYATLQSTDAQRIESNYTQFQRIVSYFNITHHTLPHTPCRCCFTAYRTQQQDHITPHDNTSTQHTTPPPPHYYNTHIYVFSG